MMGEQQLCNNFGVKKIIKEMGADYLLEDVKPIFSDADIVFGNLECSVTDFNNNKDKSLFFCADSKIVKSLAHNHFNVLSVANNHIMEHGTHAFFNTVQHLKSYKITPVGIKGVIDTLNIQGSKVTILSYSMIEDKFDGPCYNFVTSEDDIIEDIQKIRSTSDVVIVSLHWGKEYIPYPSPSQVAIGRFLIDSGADIIFGSHPHVTQSFEIYKNRPIFFSLGNFIFDDVYIKTTKHSYFVEIIITGGLDNMDIMIHPFSIDDTTYKPVMVNTSDSDIIHSANTIRSMIEDKSLEEYVRAIGDYEKLYKKIKRKVKFSEKTQFVKNLFRYSPATTVNMIRDFLLK